MKKFRPIFLILFALVLSASETHAQCSICTRTAAQLGEKPARGLNGGIIYLAIAPLAIIGFVGYRWWRRNGDAG
ncbi:MAG: hypothetical protein JWP27_1170 [Flaviaesturariibacter sp.]|nr:hypothetical protein [Flaviaesturariibacter sp.]